MKLTNKNQFNKILLHLWTAFVRASYFTYFQLSIQKSMVVWHTTGNKPLLPFVPKPEEYNYYILLWSAQ
jgi:hypothetical protein